jgi:hypothetical protein
MRLYISQKRKVIDGQSMIGEPRLCSVGSSSCSCSSSPPGLHNAPAEEEGSRGGWEKGGEGEETNPKEGFGFSLSPQYLSL